MASYRDKAFEAFYNDLKEKGVDVRDRDLMRVSWEAGRRYEVDRIDALARHRVLGDPLPISWSGPFTVED